MKLNRYGISIVLDLNFKTKEGIPSNKIKPGTWVIIFDDIPALKLKNGKFACYPECSVNIIKKNNISNITNYASNTLETDTHKYIFKNGKLQRNNFWNR